MQSQHSRLDRFVSKKLGINKRDVRLLIAQKRILIDDQPAENINQIVGQFTKVCFEGLLLQHNQPIYLMMHKPRGVVSATRDSQHKTVMELLPGVSESLHLAGRLDLNSTGLLLLTNDGSWSRKISSPKTDISKRYLVTVEKPITDEYATAFMAGMYFSYENITTKPAMLEKLSDHTAYVTLQEGKYHQIKRMFGRFRNPVVGIHRVSIGSINLDPELKQGESRTLSPVEIDLF